MQLAQRVSLSAVPAVGVSLRSCLAHHQILNQSILLATRSMVQILRVARSAQNGSNLSFSSFSAFLTSTPHTHTHTHTHLLSVKLHRITLCTSTSTPHLCTLLFSLQLFSTQQTAHQHTVYLVNTRRQRPLKHTTATSIAHKPALQSASNLLYKRFTC